MKPTEVFWSDHYRRHNQRRLEHLATLSLPLAHQSVLEVGAGIGDHTSFFLDRGCDVIVTETQQQNLAVLQPRYPALDVRQLDLNRPPAEPTEVDIVFCYGVLYHLQDPAKAIEWMARCARQLLLVETCVASGEADALHPFEEPRGSPENSPTGNGCRPTRRWVRRELSAHFAHVYMPVTQPWHEEFPLDWSEPELEGQPLIRAIFIGSREVIESPLLTKELPIRQVRELPELNR